MSCLDEEHFHSHSDIDLCVEYLADSDYFRALGDLIAESEEFGVDLIPMEGATERMRNYYMKVIYDIWDFHFFFPAILRNVSIHSFHTSSKSGKSFSIGPKRLCQTFMFHSLRLSDVRPERSGLISLIFPAFFLKHRKQLSP